MLHSQKVWHRRLRLAGCFAIAGALTELAFAIAGTSGLVLAQITPDTTLGAENSIVTPSVNVGGVTADQIDGGAVRGANLFHSFSQFNIRDGQRVYFANPVGIENILSRVTENNLSNILGTLGVLGNANLFLINPNGIVFGPNARLDIAGSFVASTANSLVFENNFTFSATNPEAPPLLSINITPGLQYGANQPQATITNTGNLVVGKNLTLSAGNLNLEGQLQVGGDLTLIAQDTAQVRDSTTTPFIASAGGKLLVQGDRRLDIFALNHPASGFFSTGDMVLRSTNPVEGDAHYSAGGNFEIEQLDGSLGNLYSPNDPIIRANGDIRFGNYTGASLHLFAGGKVEIFGTVRIIRSDASASSIVEDVTLSDGTILPINGSAEPTLDIRAGIDWSRLGGLPGNIGIGVTVPPNIFAATATSADITINNILVYDGFAANGGRVFLTNQYQPNLALAGAIGVGSIDTRDDFGGGAVTLDSRGGITLNGRIEAFPFNLATGGDVTFLAKGDITLNPGSSIDTQGLLGGTITLKSDGAIAATGSRIVSNSFTNAAGQTGGDINVTARSLSLTGGTGMTTRTFGAADAGNININVRETVAVTDGAQLQASTRGQGNAGSITIQADNSVLFDGVDSDGFSSAAFSQVLAGAAGNGGSINITTDSLVVTNGAQLAARTRGQGDGGSINLTTDSLSVSNGAQLTAQTFSQGDAGSINTTTDSLSVSNGAQLTVQTFGQGNGGSINIRTDFLSVLNGAQLLASTLEQGNAGIVKITAHETVSFDGIDSDGFSSGAFSSVGVGAEGNGGGIDIEAGSLFVTNGAQLLASTRGEGNAGYMRIAARDLVSFDRGAAFSTVESGAIGNGGDLSITARSLSLTNNAQLSASTSGQGDAGKILVQADNGVSVANGSQIRSTVESGAVGNGQDITLKTRSLSVSNDSQLSASTSGQGDAGNISVTEADSISLFNSSISTAVNAGAVGQGGNVTLQSESLSLDDRASVSAATSGTGKAGSISVQEADSVSLANGSTISTAVNAGAVVPEGTAERLGNIDIQTRSLSLTNNAQLSANTSGQGDAGNISVREADSISLSNSSISTAVNTGAVGQGGNVNIQSQSLSLVEGSTLTALSSGQGDAGNIQVNVANAINLDNSQITVNKQGTQGNAGTLDVSARFILLDNQGKLTAVTESGNGGDITLQVQDLLLLRRGSTISTTAGTAQAGGDGGNITINANLIVAVPKENSDITANAFEGRGGNISITTQGIFGLEFRQNLTPLSDITASSEFGVDGAVDINTPGVDPSRGLAALPTNLVDPSGQIGQSCPGSGGATTSKPSEFIVTGSGGLPASPSEPFRGEAVWHDLRPMTQQGTNRSVEVVQPEDLGTKKLVEAQGWVIGSNGEVILTASAPTFVPHNLQVTPIACPDSKLP
jgi:filamentous hemagglutinin family protein